MSFHTVMESWHVNAFPVTNSSWWISIGDRWIMLTRASNVWYGCFIAVSPHKPLENQLSLWCYWWYRRSSCDVTITYMLDAHFHWFIWRDNTWSSSIQIEGWYLMVTNQSSWLIFIAAMTTRSRGRLNIEMPSYHDPDSIMKRRFRDHAIFITEIHVLKRHLSNSIYIETRLRKLYTWRDGQVA